MHISPVEATSKTFESALPRVTAPLSAMGIRDRNRLIREFDQGIAGSIAALTEIAHLRVPLDLAEVDHEGVAESWRSLLDQARRLNEVVDEATMALRDKVRRLTPSRLGDFQRAAKGALETLADLRAALALALSDQVELDELGWMPPPEPPLGTRGPMRSLEDLRRENGW